MADLESLGRVRHMDQRVTINRHLIIGLLLGTFGAVLLCIGNQTPLQMTMTHAYFAGMGYFSFLMIFMPISDCFVCLLFFEMFLLILKLACPL